MQDRLNMIKDFVTYGNAITAFCVIQAITSFVTASTSNDFRKLFAYFHKRIIRIAIIWGFIYSGIILLCYACEFALRCSAKQDRLILMLSTLVVVGRLGFIWLAQWVYKFTWDGLQDIPSNSSNE
jgi:hypothetical protein